MFSFIFIIFIIYLSFTNYEILVNTIISSLSNFLLLLIPSLFLMIILVQVLSSNKIMLKIIKVLHIFTKKIFNFTTLEETYIFFFSFLGGTTTTAVNINTSILNKEISNESGEKLITYLAFPSPLYLYKTTVLYGSKIQFIIIFSMYIVPLLFLLYSKSTSDIIKAKTSFKEESLFTIIEQAFNTLIKVFSFILFFSMIINLIFSKFNFSNNIKYIISNLVELTIGGNYRLSSSIILEIFCLILFNNFLGLSIIFQIKSIINTINIKKFIINRFIIGIVSGLCGVLLFINIYYIVILVCLILIILLYKYIRSRQPRPQLN